jgi:hypothetical protein
MLDFRTAGEISAVRAIGREPRAARLTGRFGSRTANRKGRYDG